MVAGVELLDDVDSLGHAGLARLLWEIHRTLPDARPVGILHLTDRNDKRSAHVAGIAFDVLFPRSFLTNDVSIAGSNRHRLRHGGERADGLCVEFPNLFDGIPATSPCRDDDAIHR